MMKFRVFRFCRFGPAPVVHTLLNYLTLSLKVFKLSVFLNNSGRLYHKERPANEIAFQPMFV